MVLSSKKQPGFTIVELLIVIVVIGILAAITIVAYNGIQSRARDTQRKSDTTVITQALEYYYSINGEYPPSSGSTAINTSWSTTADASWQNLVNQLVPKYVSSLSVDPINTKDIFVASSAANYSYAYYANKGTYCGVGVGQMYLLVYRLESIAQDNHVDDCVSSPIINTYSGASNYRVVK